MMTHEELINFTVDHLWERLGMDDDILEDVLQDWAVSNNIVDLAAISGDPGSGGDDAEMQDREFDAYGRWMSGVMAAVYLKMGVQMIQRVPELLEHEKETEGS